MVARTLIPPLYARQLTAGAEGEPQTPPSAAGPQTARERYERRIGELGPQYMEAAKGARAPDVPHRAHRVRRQFDPAWYQRHIETQVNAERHKNRLLMGQIEKEAAFYNRLLTMDQKLEGQPAAADPERKDFRSYALDFMKRQGIIPPITKEGGIDYDLVAQPGFLQAQAEEKEQRDRELALIEDTEADREEYNKYVMDLAKTQKVPPAMTPEGAIDIKEMERLVRLSGSAAALNKERDRLTRRIDKMGTEVQRLQKAADYIGPQTVENVADELELNRLLQEMNQLEDHREWARTKALEAQGEVFLEDILPPEEEGVESIFGGEPGQVGMPGAAGGAPEFLAGALQEPSAGAPAPVAAEGEGQPAAPEQEDFIAKDEWPPGYEASWFGSYMFKGQAALSGQETTAIMQQAIREGAKPSQIKAILDFHAERRLKGKAGAE